MALFSVSWIPGGFVHREPAEAALRDVARRLALSEALAAVRVRVTPHSDHDHARVSWVEAPRLRVRIDSDLGNFLTPASGRFSPRAARAIFLHELSHVRDSLAYGIDSSALPRGRWVPFNEAWNVWIDGRLSRRGLPALTRRERWREFHDTFAPPPGRSARARQVFSRLWRAEVLSQRDLLDAVEALVG